MQDLIILSDIHLAKKWDDLDNVFSKKINFLNPNKYLREVIASTKSTDTLIFNGDLVDYYFCNYLDEKDNNWDIFLDVVKNSKGKYFFNLGNHDYRKRPYNFSIYGLNHVNINSSTRIQFLREIGFNKFRFWGELDSIRVNLSKFNPIPKEISSSPKKFKTDKSEVLMLNTGPDALTKITQIMNPFSWPFVLSTHPSSIGLSDKEIQILKNSLSKEEKRELIIFLHCPPFFSKNNITPIKLSKISYSFSLIANKLTYATFVKNNWKFIDLLIKSNRNITVVTSHSHIPKQYLIDKKNRILKQTSIKEINILRKQRGYIKFISTLPLGAIGHSNKIGYLRIGKKKIEYNVLKEFDEITF